MAGGAHGAVAHAGLVSDGGPLARSWPRSRSASRESFMICSPPRPPTQGTLTPSFGRRRLPRPTRLTRPPHTTRYARVLISLTLAHPVLTLTLAGTRTRSPSLPRTRVKRRAPNALPHLTFDSSSTAANDVHIGQRQCVLRRRCPRTNQEGSSEVGVGL